MKCISWNCRGLGNPAAVRALKKILKQHCPDFVFLMETRLKSSDSKAKSSLLCGPLSNLYMSDCTITNGRRAGGLALIWNNVVTIDIILSNKNFIDMYITSLDLNIAWYATGFYGYPYYSSKHLTCKHIQDINQTRVNENWLIFDDFNLILNSSEKLGGNCIDFHHTKMFNETLNTCDLKDLGFTGNIFTWANNQTNNMHIKERIDRFCANTNWLNLFPIYVNKHLLRYSSDHNPILLEFEVTTNYNCNTPFFQLKNFITNIRVFNT